MLGKSSIEDLRQSEMFRPKSAINPYRSTRHWCVPLQKRGLAACFLPPALLIGIYTLLPRAIFNMEGVGVGGRGVSMMHAQSFDVVLLGR